MKLFKQLINNNTFIYKNGQVQWMNAQKNNNQARAIGDSLLPVLIIAREHYQEIEREYPVPDKRDVRNIIDNEFQNLKMTRIEAKDLNTSKAKIFTFDAATDSFIREHLCIYIPETLLSKFLQEQELTTVERLGQPLNLIRKGDTVFSSAGIGLYQNPQLFLASSGVGEATSALKLTEADYFKLLLEQVDSLKSGDLMMILSGQVSHKQVFQRIHLPSIGLGVAASVALYWTLLWGQLKWAEEYATTDYSAEDVKAVIQSRQKLDTDIALYNELNGAQVNQIDGEMIWQLVISLLETDVSVGGLLYEDGELKLSLQAVSATEAIKFVRAYDNVQSVVTDGDIYDVQGKQAVRVIVLFDKETTDV